ncbi:hypothetical protein QV08_11620, partial [Gallibacterium salpingitidis]|uniref:recombination-associated protein RdgC n=1 Tax=Gallibacterium salpingitidis TaxID=505341 RepID=UPI000805323D
MNYEDYIKMTQCAVYSITFPTDNIIEKLESAEFPDHIEGKFEIVKNLLTGKKVMQLEDGGIYFSIRAEFKQITKQLIACKMIEFKDMKKRDAEHLARVELYQALPPSSELYNVFYNPATQILVINNKSKRSNLALSLLVELFGLVGVKSVVVSTEKLGINTKFKQYLADRTPLFNSLGFDYEATLRRETDEETNYRTCRYLDTDEGLKNAKQAMNDGFSVQSLAMRYVDEYGCMLRFKLDEHLNIRSMKFADYAETARMLRGDHAGKAMILQDYILQQYHILNR